MKVQVPAIKKKYFPVPTTFPNLSYAFFDAADTLCKGSGFFIVSSGGGVLGHAGEQ